MIAATGRPMPDNLPNLKSMQAARSEKRKTKNEKQATNYYRTEGNLEKL
jgi:hypothetical protein